MKGHWVCANCGQEVKLPPPVGRWDAKRGATCPLCHKPECDWIKNQPVAPERAQKLFAQIRVFIA